MAEIMANGVRLHVQRLGAPADGKERQTVVMIHGLATDNLSSFYFTIGNPVALEHEVILYDMRGHGRSERPPTGYTVDDGVADLLGLLDALEVHHPVVLLSNSYGGAVALGFAAAHPDRLAGMVMVESHFPVDGWGEHMAGSLAILAFGMDDESSKEYLAQQGTRKLNRLAKQASGLIYDTTMLADLETTATVTDAQLAAIDVPMLALYGSGSDIVARAEDLERCVPNCELEMFGDQSHWLLLEHPHGIVTRVLPFLASLGTDREAAELQRALVLDGIWADGIGIDIDLRPGVEVVP